MKLKPRPLLLCYLFENGNILTLDYTGKKYDDLSGIDSLELRKKISENEGELRVVDYHAIQQLLNENKEYIKQLQNSSKEHNHILTLLKTPKKSIAKVSNVISECNKQTAYTMKLSAKLMQELKK